MAITKFNVVEGLSVGDIVRYDVIDNAANVTANNLTVSANSNLGSVSNITITGGTTGYVLRTDGTGNLSWVNPASAGLAGSNTQIQFNNNGVFGASPNLTFNIGTNVFSVTNISASGNITSGNANVGTLVSTSTVDFNVASNVNLGNISNLHILGGSPGYVIKTDGNGNLSWGIDTTSAGGTNTQVQFNDGGSLGGNTNFTFDKLTSLLTVTGNINALNANLGNLVAANYFDGNGSLLTSITGANVTGQVGNALIAGTVYSNAQPNITSLGNLNSLTIIGNLSSGNANLGNLVVANYFSGNGSLLSSITGGNVTGQVGNAIIAGTVYTNAQPNITSLGTLSSLTVSGNAEFTGSNIFVSNISNLKIPGGSNGYVLKTDGTGNLSWGTDITDYGNTNVAAYLPTYGGLISGTLTTAEQPNITSVGNLASLTVIGNILSGNASLGNLATANYFSGNGSLLSSITGANVTGQVGNALIAGTVYTNAQPNITSVGTLSGLSVSGNATIAGNLTVNGTTIYANVSTLNVKDPIIEMGGTGNDDPLTSNDGKDRGTLLHYYTTAPVNAFMGWDNSNGEFGFGSNVTVTNEVVTWNSYGNIRANYIIANGSLLTSITGGNVTGQVSNALIAGTVYTNAQPNITSLGTLSSLTVTSNVDAGNIRSDNLLYANGTPYVFTTDAAGSNTQVQFNDSNAFAGSNSFTFNKTTNTLSVTNFSVANITANGLSNLGDISNVKITGGTAGYILSTDGLGNLAWSTAGGAGFVSITKDNFVGNGVQTSFNLSTTATGEEAVMVNIDGLVQQDSVYTISGSVLTFASPPFNGVNIEVTIFGALSLTQSNTQVLYFSGNSLAGSNNFVFDDTTNTLSVNNISSIANVTAGNIKADNLLYANGTPYVFTTNAAGSNTQVQFNDGNSFAGSANFTFDKATNTLSVTNIIGNGAGITYITGGNVNGQVANALVAGTVYTNAQPNITSLGNLSNLNVTGNANVGNLLVTGNVLGSLIPNANVTYDLGSNSYRWNDLYLSGNSIYLGGVVLTSDGNNITADGNVNASNANLGNLAIANYFTGNGYLLSSLNGSNVTGQVGNALVAGTVYTNAQPNITSVGTLTSLSITGNVTSGNANLGNTVTANYFQGDGSLLTNLSIANASVANANYAAFAGNVVNASQPNITSLGNLSSLIVNGNITAGNLDVDGGTVTIDTGIITVSSGNAGIFTVGISNTNIGLGGNVTLGSTSGNVVIQGNLSVANITTITNLKINDLYSNRTPVTISTGTVIDSFSITKYRSAKYTMRVNSDDGYQAVEVLLIHDGSNSYVTIYGSLSTIGVDIITLATDIVSGNVRMLASTASPNTTVNLLGTYVSD